MFVSFCSLCLLSDLGGRTPSRAPAQWNIQRPDLVFPAYRSAGRSAGVLRCSIVNCSRGTPHTRSPCPSKESPPLNSNRLLLKYNKRKNDSLSSRRHSAVGNSTSVMTWKTPLFYAWRISSCSPISTDHKSTDFNGKDLPNFRTL